VASIYDIKPAFQNLLRPVVGALANAGVTANQVTVTALVLSFAGGAALALQPGARGPLLFLPIILFVRMALNAIDGMLAREHNMISRRGAVLNEVGDVVSDTVLYLPLALIPFVDATWVVLAVVLAGLSEMTGVLAQVTIGQRRYDGPMGKSDRAFVFGLLGLAMAFGFSNEIVIRSGLIIVNVLMVVTVLNRARHAASGSP